MDSLSEHNAPRERVLGDKRSQICTQLDRSTPIQRGSLFEFHRARALPRRHHDEPESLLGRTTMLAMATRLVDAIDKTLAPIHPAALRFSTITVAGRPGQCCVVCDVFEESA